MKTWKSDLDAKVTKGRFSGEVAIVCGGKNTRTLFVWEKLFPYLHGRTCVLKPIDSKYYGEVVVRPVDPQK